MSSTRKSTFGSAKRVLATAASAAMIFALLPAGIAMGASPDNVCPPPDGAETFPDVSSGVHADNIECLAGYDIAQGYPDGEYKPELDITRAQMATFVANLIEAALGTTLDEGDDAFTDDESSVHESNINKLANINVVTGRTATTYGPSLVVNRAAMATFIANALDYIDDQDVDNSYPPASTTDHFTDDEASTHEDNINRLADQGIVEGQDSSTEYNPGNNVFRGQMATFVMESASEAEEDLDAWAANDVAPTTNQDFTATPSDAAENTVSAASPNQNRGARQYSVSGLDDDTTYDITLFPAENVTVDDNGVVTFVDNNENSTAGDNEADLDGANVDAVIEVVNGSDVADAESVEASPVNGTITFTVDSATADSVRPVVYVDTENDGTVELDANNQPTEDFGVGGQKTWIPAEAGQGDIGATDEAITSVNKDANRFITADGTYFYDSNDTFFIADTTDEDAGGGTANEECDGASDQVTMEDFEAQLSAGDEIDEQSVYQPSEGLSSSFCLEDLAPAAPSITAVDEETEDGAEVTLTGVTSGATVTVYCEEDANTDDAEVVTTSDQQCGQSATDADTTEANFQIVLSGLSASTNYDIAANQTVDGETSPLSAESNVTTTAVGVSARPTITNAVLTTDANLQGVMDTGDVWTLTFDQDMAATTASDGQFVVEDPDGDRYQVDCDGTGVAEQASVVDAQCVLSADSSGNADRILTITIQDASIEAAEDLSGTSQGDNLAEYPMTITSVSANVEDEQGDNLDLANSADKVVDQE